MNKQGLNVEIFCVFGFWALPKVNCKRSRERLHKKNKTRLVILAIIMLDLFVERQDLP